MNIAVIFAGGSGKRMHTKSRPKQFLEYQGKPIIIYTLELFDNHPMIDGIVVACVKEWIPFLEKMLNKFEINKVKKIVPGGDTGQDRNRIQHPRPLRCQSEQEGCTWCSPHHTYSAERSASSEDCLVYKY